MDWSIIIDHQEDMDVDILEEHFTKNIHQVVNQLAQFKTRNLGKRKKKPKSDKVLAAEKNWKNSYKRLKKIKPLVTLTKTWLLHYFIGLHMIKLNHEILQKMCL